MKTVFILFTTAALLFSGCISVNLPKQDIQETKTYDIALEHKDSFPFTVEVQPFRSDSPAKYKMLIRDGNELVVNEYNKWSQTPSRMMTQNFRSAFKSAAKNGPAFKISGNILAFELDEKSKSAILSVNYTISLQNELKPLYSHIINTKVQLKEFSPDAFAQAMKQAVSKQIADVKKLILDSVKVK